MPRKQRRHTHILVEARETPHGISGTIRYSPIRNVCIGNHWLPAYSLVFGQPDFKRGEGIVLFDLHLKTEE